jgi:hypothetical protein
MSDQPDIHRVGHAWFVAQGIGKMMLRAVHLRSFSFYLAFWQRSERRAEIDISPKYSWSETRQPTQRTTSTSPARSLSNRRLPSGRSASRV